MLKRTPSPTAPSSSYRRGEMAKAQSRRYQAEQDRQRDALRGKIGGLFTVARAQCVADKRRGARAQAAG